MLDTYIVPIWNHIAGAPAHGSDDNSGDDDDDDDDDGDDDNDDDHDDGTTCKASDGGAGELLMPAGLSRHLRRNPRIGMRCIFACNHLWISLLNLPPKADIVAASTCFLGSPDGNREVRERALYMLAAAFLQHYLRANITGPVPEGDDASLPFHPSALAEGASHSAILAALEADGEPAYELLACPGYLWLSALLLGLVSSDMPKCNGVALPFWRARCAFAWQLSLAEASERGCGQCPSLFRAAVHELVTGEAASPAPLSGKGLLDASTLEAIQAATAPLQGLI